MKRGALVAVGAIGVLSLAVGAGIAWVGGKQLGSILPPHEQCQATLDEQTVVLDFEQAESAAIIAGMAVRRGLPARAVTIALATAYQESDLRNLSHGDRDSLGLFQQRPSQGWGTPEQVRDPSYATNAFYDELIKVSGYRDLPITEAAQAVQRSAFPGAYADHEDDARVLASALSGYSPGSFWCEVPEPSDLPAEQPTASGLT